MVAIFLGRLARGEVPHIFGDGKQQRDYVFVGDVATVVLAALERPAGVFNVGTGVATSVLDLYEACRPPRAPTWRRSSTRRASASCSAASSIRGSPNASSASAQGRPSRTELA